MAEPASARTDLPGEGSGRSARDNPGDWIPFLDWREVFPGNRGVDRRGVYNLFDAPVGIALQVEPSEPSEPLLVVEKSWEDPANMQPSATWREASTTIASSRLKAFMLESIRAHSKACIESRSLSSFPAPAALLRNWSKSPQP